MKEIKNVYVSIFMNNFRREKMRKEPTLEQWSELYKLGLKIRSMEPWNIFQDLDIIAVEIPNRKEPYFCSLLGAGGQCFGVNTFVGYEGLRNYLIIADDENYMTLDYIMVEQSNLACFFGDKERVPEEQMRIMKSLGIKFRGKNKWIYFQSYKKGHMPTTIDEDEAEVLKICLKELLNAIKDLKKLQLDLNFDAGDVLVRRFNKVKGRWGTTKECITQYLYGYPSLILKDEILAAKLKRKPRSEEVLEIDMIYIKVTIDDELYERPIRPKLLLLVGHYEGLIIGQHFIVPESDEIQDIMESFINYIMEYGRPVEVYIRNPFIENILKHTCDICGIKLTMKKSLDVVDDFIDGFEVLGL